MRIEARVVGHQEIDPNERVSLDHVNLRGADYSGRVLIHFGAIGSYFEKCLFKDARVDDFSFGAGKEVSEYIECNFDGLRFRHSIGGTSRFVRCSFRNVELADWLCFTTELVDCTFTGRLRKCIFNGMPLEEDRVWRGRDHNEFHGNDFSGAELIDVGFRTGIDLDLQRLPTGPDYLFVADGAAAIDRAKRGLAEWKPDTELQRLALAMVTVKANAVADGQRQFLMHLPEYYKGRRKFPREVVDKVIELFGASSER